MLHKSVCRAVFSPLVFGGLAKSLNIEYANHRKGADEASIWFVWISFIIIMLGTYAQDEFSGKHCSELNELQSPYGLGDLCHDDEESPIELVDRSYGENEMINNESQEGNAALYKLRKKMKSMWAEDRPEGALAMVPWYSILLVYSAFDILVQLKVLLGRFDARALQTKVSTSSRRIENCGKEGISGLQERYPGCVFECKPQDNDSKGVWVDFVADTGDGFNSSYQVARMLAQPSLVVKTPNKKRILPRGSHLVIGGDLAYPDPTPESYEKRFFRTFSDAMSPPPCFSHTAISTSKPAFPIKGWDGDLCFRKKAEPENTKKDILGRYKGPCAFALPGNHDWFDGLSTFTRYILSRDWLGGWLMPQMRSYFALKLASGWWLLGFDLALSSDIDIDQFKFFASVATKAMKKSDAVIVVTHEPHWVLDEDRKAPLGELAEENLRELMDTYLKGKVRARIAGDLHHYSRHVPMRPKKSPTPTRRRSRIHPKTIQPENKPELIVSGGGGAFLHGTHTFEKQIRVGPTQEKYTRVGCFPDERVSRRLAWLNMWQFRWRNWRIDLVWAVGYFGISSSLFPLCGIYRDYLDANPSHNPLVLITWISRNIMFLLREIFVSGRTSLLFVIGVLCALYVMTDSKMKQSVRLLWGLSHGLAHMSAALGCLLFVEVATEWVIDEGIVKVTGSVATAVPDISENGAIDLASSLYQEYTAHFSQVFVNVTSALQQNISSVPVLHRNIEYHFGSMSAFELFHAKIYTALIHVWKWLFNEVPLLGWTLSVFDLPGTIAQKHTDICTLLCKDGTECLISNDYNRYMLLDRVALVSYSAAIFLYFFVLAVPFAGGIFGTWLSLTLNVFKAQYNEGFSSLRIEHWKNFLKLHINDKGDLEVFAIGLHRVPNNWVKDYKWSGRKKAGDKSETSSFHDGQDEKKGVPSWLWKRPSKWIPQNDSEKFVPEVVDYTLIAKRRNASSEYGMDDTCDSTHVPSTPELSRSSSF